MGKTWSGVFWVLAMGLMWGVERRKNDEIGIKKMDNGLYPCGGIGRKKMDNDLYPRGASIKEESSQFGALIVQLGQNK